MHVKLVLLSILTTKELMRAIEPDQPNRVEQTIRLVGKEILQIRRSAVPTDANEISGGVDSLTMEPPLIDGALTGRLAASVPS